MHSHSSLCSQRLRLQLVLDMWLLLEWVPRPCECAVYALVSLQLRTVTWPSLVSCDGGSRKFCVFAVSQTRQKLCVCSPSRSWVFSCRTVAGGTGAGPSSSRTCRCRWRPARRCPCRRSGSRGSRAWTAPGSSSSRLREDPCKLSVITVKGQRVNTQRSG